MSATPPEELARRVVALLAHRPFAWFTDVDGTISRITGRPEEATVEPRLRTLVERLARHVDHFVVVSGRSPEQARTMVGLDGVTYIGNHGLSWLERGEVRHLPDAEPYIPAVAEAAEQVRQAVDLDGIIVENKGPIVALHYRLTADPQATRAAIVKAARRYAAPLGLQVEEGRRVIELWPPVVRDKGTAVREFVETHGISGALYIGDDLTDIDAFRALESLQPSVQGLRIAVAAAEGPPQMVEEADASVYGVDGVVQLITAILDILRDGPGP